MLFITNISNDTIALIKSEGLDINNYIQTCIEEYKNKKNDKVKRLDITEAYTDILHLLELAITNKTVISNVPITNEQTIANMENAINTVDSNGFNNKQLEDKKSINKDKNYTTIGSDIEDNINVVNNIEQTEKDVNKSLLLGMLSDLEDE